MLHRQSALWEWLTQHRFAAVAALVASLLLAMLLGIATGGRSGLAAGWLGPWPSDQGTSKAAATSSRGNLSPTGVSALVPISSPSEPGSHQGDDVDGTAPTASDPGAPMLDPLPPGVVRRLPIPQKVQGRPLAGGVMPCFDTTLITSREALEAFVDSATTQLPYPEQTLDPDFVTPLQAIDFGDDVLLLISRTVGSGGYHVELTARGVRDRQAVLGVHVGGLPEGTVGDCAMTDHFFALAVDRHFLDSVLLETTFERASPVREQFTW